MPLLDAAWPCSAPRSAHAGCRRACPIRTSGGRWWRARCRPCRHGTAPGRPSHCGPLARRRASRADLRVRHQAAWPEDLAQRTDDAHRVGDAITTSKFITPPLICSARSSMPTMSAPAALGLFSLRALREHRHTLGLAGALASRRRREPPDRTSSRRCRAAPRRRSIHRTWRSRVP